jgi:hypothetical protein
VFRRRRPTDEIDEDGSDFDDFDDSEDGDAAAEATHAADPGEYGANVVHPGAEPTASPVVHAPTTGPWDFRDKPRDDDRPRVDLGGMRLPIPEGVELRVEAQEDVIVAAVLVDGASQILVNAFAAPKSKGIWPEVRAEIIEALRTQGGSASETEGPLGTELTAQIPAETGGLQPARFVGAEGPRWFLRGLITGGAAGGGAAAAKLEDAFREIVVNRGPDAMAPRDPIPLHLPREIIEGAAQAAAAAEEETPERQFELRERGPEITETR